MPVLCFPQGSRAMQDYERQLRVLRCDEIFRRACAAWQSKVPCKLAWGSLRVFNPAYSCTRSRSVQQAGCRFGSTMWTRALQQWSSASTSMLANGPTRPIFPRVCVGNATRLSEKC